MKKILLITIAVVLCIQCNAFAAPLSDKSYTAECLWHKTISAKSAVGHFDIITDNAPSRVSYSSEDTFTNAEIVKMLLGKWRRSDGSYFYVNDTFFYGWLYRINRIEQTGGGHKTKAYIFCDIAPEPGKNAKYVPFVVIMTFYRGTFLSTFAVQSDGSFDENTPAITASKEP